MRNILFLLSLIALLPFSYAALYLQLPLDLAIATAVWITGMFVAFFRQQFSPCSLRICTFTTIVALGYQALQILSKHSLSDYSAELLLSAPLLFWCTIQYTIPNEKAPKWIHFIDSRLFTWLCTLFSAGGILLAAVCTFFPNIWVDEAFSLALINRPWGEMLRVAALDVHPPLYYIILKGIVDTVHFLLPYFSAEVLGKWTSLLPYLLLIILALTKVRKHWGNCAAALCALAVTAAPSMLSQSVEIRMYTWAFLFVTTAYIYAYDVMVSGNIRHWLIFSTCGLAAAYTHYYACIAVSPVYIFLLYTSAKQSRRQLLLWLGSALMAVLGYLPWLFIFLHQASTVQSDYWIVLPDVPAYSKYAFFLLRSPLSLIVIIPLITWLIKEALIRHATENTALYLLTGFACCLSTIIVGLLVSYSLRPVFVARYMYPGLVCGWFALIFTACYLRRKVPQFAIFLLLISLLFYHMFRFTLTEGTAHKSEARFRSLLLNNPHALLITDDSAIRRTCATQYSRKCLCYDKDTQPLSDIVFSDNSTSHIDNLDSVLTNLTGNHPAYIIMLSNREAPSHEAILAPYYKDKVKETQNFRYFLIPGN